MATHPGPRGASELSSMLEGVTSKNVTLQFLEYRAKSSCGTVEVFRQRANDNFPSGDSEDDLQTPEHPFIT